MATPKRQASGHESSKLVLFAKGRLPSWKIVRRNSIQKEKLMKKDQKCFGLACILLFAAGLIFLPAHSVSAVEQEMVLVGRIAETEGQILRYVPDTQDWVATVKDAPFGLEDALYSDQTARGEFIMPNGIWVRIGGSTQIQLIALKMDASEIDIASGVARFYNKSADGMLKVTTPFGYVLAEPSSAFDLYVGDQSAEVIGIGRCGQFYPPEG